MDPDPDRTGGSVNRAADPDYGVPDWDWGRLKSEAACRGQVVLHDIRGADYRHAIAKEAARHGLYLKAEGPATVLIVLGP